MRNLIDFLSRHNHWFVFLLVEALGFALLMRHNSYQGSAWFSTANAVVGQIYAWDAKVETFFSLTRVNEDLVHRNIVLERQVAELSSRMADLTGDTVWRSRPLESSLRLIPAKVVTNSVNSRDNLITIDKGRADGVAPDMGVACGHGIVGIVYLASEHYAVVIPVLNSRSNISCQLRGRGYFGYLHWTGGRADEANVDDVPRHARFRLGDEVVTSGYSSVFPAGMSVGRVLHVYNSADGMAYRLRVRLSVDFGKLRDVCVIAGTEGEGARLLRAAQDSLKLGGRE